MNTISNSQSTIDVYALKRIREAKDLEEVKIQHEKKREETDSILISQQELQTAQVSPSSSPLDSLVCAGTITQDQANAIQSVFQSGGKEIQASGTYSNKVKPQNPLDSLVVAGTITQAQKDEIQSTFQSAIQANRSSNETTSTRTNPLDSLVADGTITQEQEDTIESAFQALMETNRTNKPETTSARINPLDSLVIDGTITQEQADAIESTLQAAM